MIWGHFATALVAKARVPAAPLWLFLLASNLPDFIWFGLTFLGIEKAEPSSFLDATFSNLRIDMPYSHTVLPTLIVSLVVAGVVYFVMKDLATAIWTAVLNFFHLVCDLISGFDHEFVPRGTAKIGLNLYGTSPHLAILLEAALAVACVWYFINRRDRSGTPLSKQKQFLLYLVFIVGILVWLPTGTIPLREMLPFLK